jgi:hypothetical protein
MSDDDEQRAILDWIADGGYDDLAKICADVMKGERR